MNDALALWVDIETTGLDPEWCDPVEIAVILTDTTLEFRELDRFHSLIAVDPNYTYWEESAEELHTRTGLMDDLFDPRIAKYSRLEAERTILEMIDRHTTGKVILAGSGVSHFDRHVIDVQFESLAKRLEYFALDIGPVRRFARIAGIAFDGGDQAAKTHRALSDIEQHLTEARAFIAWARSVDRLAA